MKKVLPYCFIICLLFIVLFSCSKRTNAPSITFQDPSAEAGAIDSFIQASDTLLTAEGTNAIGLVRHYIDKGDTTAILELDSNVAIIQYKVTLLNNQVVDSTAANKNDTVYLDKTALIPALSYYLVRLGKGGIIHFVTPSAYAYGSQPQNFIGTEIPPNSPLYYEVHLIDVHTPAEL